MAAYEQLVSVSGAATNGQIPQANGSGGYAWVTPAAGVNPSSATPVMDGTGAAGTSADYARGDHVHPTDTSRAPLASPTFTGTPSAPTAAAGTNTTQLATTAFVTTAVANKSVPTATTTTPKMDGTAAVGSETKWAKGDHVHPTDTSRAASDHVHGNITNAGAITATGVALANNDTLVFVDSSDSSKLKQTSIKFDGSTATKALTQKGTFETFLTSHQDISGLAPKASPALTGTPTAPTATAGTNTTQIATTAFVQNALSASSSMVKVNVGTVASLPVTVNSAMITSDMELIRAELGTPSAQTSDWTVTTANGSVTISGTVSAESTSLILYLSTVQSTS